MVNICYVGHATVVVDIGQIRVLTDPLLRDRITFLRRYGHNPAPDLLAARPPDLVLLSHLHYDHTDLPSLRQLAAGTVVVAPRGSGRYLRQGTGLEVVEVMEGDRFQVADVEVTALPAEHGRRFSLPVPGTSCLGFALRNHMSVYFAGDTALFDGMHDVGRDYCLDVALLPVWGYSPHVGPEHLTPLTAAEALTRLQPRVAVPIHWGALRLPGPRVLWQAADHLRLPPRTFAGHAARLAPATEVRVLQPGQWTRIAPQAQKTAE